MRTKSWTKKSQEEVDVFKRKKAGATFCQHRRMNQKKIDGSMWSILNRLILDRLSGGWRLQVLDYMFEM